MKKKKYISLILNYIFFSFNVAVNWGILKFDTVGINEIFFYTHMSMGKADLSFLNELWIYMIPKILVFILVVGILSFLFVKKSERLFKISMIFLSYINLTIFVFFLCSFFEIPQYVYYCITSSNFIENNYVAPENTSIQFPNQKRNLIYIYLESMESSYMDYENGGQKKYNLIPELTELCKNNINFSDNDKSGGFYMLKGAEYTTASLVSQSSGLPLKVPRNLLEDSTSYKSFLPGIYGIGEVLEKEGYYNQLMVDDEAAFGGVADYYTQHGNYHIFDYKEAIKEHKIPKDYHEWWGFEDHLLFQFAKDKALQLSNKDQPFNITLFTMDTHFSDGYLCSQCQNKYKDQYANVIACSSKQVSDFVQWVSQQDFYKNTTIVICGDHLTMQNDFFTQNSTENRRVYDVIINSPITPKKEKNRCFTALDMFPTTLAALGANIEGNQLGLGVNLFSEKKTLCEKYGFDKVNKEVQKKSNFYNTNVVKKGKTSVLP